MTVLCYHEVHPEWQSPLAITPDAFEQQCRWLSRKRTVVSLRDVAARLIDGKRLPLDTVVLTFDDGFTGLHEYALPILRKYGLTATVFLVAKTIAEPGSAVDWVDTPPSWDLATLTVDQIREMSESGIDFESHSFAHADLTSLDPDACVDDLTQSRQVLEEALGEPVRYLAYPRGFHNAGVRAATAAAGYRAGLALPESREPRGAYSVPRVGVFPGNTGLSFAMKSHPLYARVRTSRLYPWLRLAATGNRPQEHQAANPD